jgi:molybdenum cofactor cytidylyltransferase
MTHHHITAVLLAAGTGERFRASGGGGKLLSLLPNGQVMAVQSLLNLKRCLGADGRSVVAVVRPEQAQLASLLHDHGALVVKSDAAHRGMGASLAAGLGRVAENSDVLIALGDMPYVAPSTLQAICHALAAGASIVQPCVEQRRGNPVGFSSRWLANLRTLNDDWGARHILKEHQAEVLLLPTTDEGIFMDIDTLAALHRPASTPR